MVIDMTLDACFSRKARLFTDEHKVYTPPFMTHASIVSIESVRIVILIAAFNGPDVKFSDIQNYYININPKERVYLYSVEEFDKGWVNLVVLVRALYGLKVPEVHGQYLSGKLWYT